MVVGVENHILVSLPPFLQWQNGHTAFQGLRDAGIAAEYTLTCANAF